MTVQPPFALTQALATFAATTLELPAAALEVAAQGLTDAAGLIVKARHEAVVHAVLQVHAPAGTSGPCSLLLGPGSAGPLDAAMVNGTAAHAFALDDVAWGCHPSAMLLPALLAVGEMQDASGAELLRAWVVGYEVLAELASREPGSLHTTGWHPSGLLGPVAVAAAVAKLMRLDAASTLAALSNAASMSGGVSANFGTTMKAVHVGQVASAGVRACLLARAGVAGSADVLERARGLLATVYGRLRDPGLTAEDCTTVLEAAYRQAPCVSVLPVGTYPSTKWVRQTNRALISVQVDQRTGQLVVMSAIDNLIKGQAGQGVQCLNLLAGLPATTGLPLLPFYP